MLLCINACIDSPNKADLSTCGHGFDQKKLRGEYPWGSTDSVNQKDVGFGWVKDSLSYHTLTDFGFICKSSKRDTCWYDKTYPKTIMYGDTFPANDCGMESDCGPIVTCHMDSLTEFDVDTRNFDEYRSKRVNPKLMLDTITNPAKRSIYRKWWPLPREPWPKGESVAADSTWWRDSVITKAGNW